MTAGLSFNNLLTHLQRTTVTLDGAGAGTAAVVFDPTFISLPAILVVPDKGDEAGGAVYKVEPTTPAPTKSGFTIDVTASGLLSQDIQVITFAHEKN